MVVEVVLISIDIKYIIKNKAKISLTHKLNEIYLIRDSFNNWNTKWSFFVYIFSSFPYYILTYEVAMSGSSNLKQDLKCEKRLKQSETWEMA